MDFMIKFTRDVKIQKLLDYQGTDEKQELRAEVRIVVGQRVAFCDTHDFPHGFHGE